jgi:OmpA family protein
MADKARATRLKAGLDKREREYLKRISDLLASSQVSADAVGAVLPDAIQSRPKQDNNLAKSMVTTVETAIDQSITQDAAVMSDVLYPIIGAAIRKAIQQFVQSTMSRVNGGLESTLSIKRLGWRIQSWRTKTPYGEIVLKNTLQARVEQVFLIHKKTSLLVNSAVTEQSLVEDEDMVTSMLTAVRDFARDSVKTEGSDSLDSFQVGDYTVLMIEGRNALLAAIIWGTPGQEIREQLADGLESIELNYRGELEAFSGDMSPLANTKSVLDTCLIGEGQASAKKSPIAAVALVVLVVAGLGYLLSTEIAFAVRLRRYVDELNATPGIIITDVDSGWRNAAVSGLRDPLGSSPASILPEFDLDPERMVLQFDSYYSSEPELVVRRAAQILGASSIEGITLDGETLTVPRGLASTSNAALLQLVPGISRVVVDSGPTDALIAQSRALAAIVLRFQSGSGQLADANLSDARTAIDLATAIYRDAAEIQVPVHFLVTGRAAGSINDAEATTVSQQRADVVARLLVENGIPPAVVTSQGAGINAAIGLGAAEDPEINRSASVSVDFE